MAGSWFGFPRVVLVGGGAYIVVLGVVAVLSAGLEVFVLLVLADLFFDFHGCGRYCASDDGYEFGCGQPAVGVG